MKKRYSMPLRFCILCLQILLGVVANGLTAKADLILDDCQIDGSQTICFDNQPLREIQYNGTVVWRAGANITYIIDDGVSETHFVPYGQTTLAAIGSKAGYEFVGWQPDATASGDVLTEDLCTGDEKTLYAVFRKAVTVSYYNGSSTKQTSVKYIYYNNGNTSNPEFTISQASLSGWTARGWSTGQAANAGVSYSVLNSTTLTSDVTLYGVYQKTITASFAGNGSTSGTVAAMTGTAYYNSAGNTLNPSFKMPKNGFAKNGYAWIGWMQGSTGIVREAEESVTLSADTTFAAQWQSAVHNFSCTKNVQAWTVPVTGYYQLEVWGASGGRSCAGADTSETSTEAALGGNGGYSVGYKYFDAGTTIYICVGGEGSTCPIKYVYEDWTHQIVDNSISGGYNGGGGAGSYENDGINNNAWPHLGGAGGGATHIATTNRGELKNYESNKSELIIVAGGGGGGCVVIENTFGKRTTGGSGGGLDGGIPVTYNHETSYSEDENKKSTQTTGYAFGEGQSGYSGGGGGWYGGREVYGGSGYIGGVMSSLNYNGQTYTSKTATSSHTGDGAVTITYLGR